MKAILKTTFKATALLLYIAAITPGAFASAKSVMAKVPTVKSIKLANNENVGWSIFDAVSDDEELNGLLISDKDWEDLELDKIFVTEDEGETSIVAIAKLTFPGKLTGLILQENYFDGFESYTIYLLLYNETGLVSAALLQAEIADDTEETAKLTTKELKAGQTSWVSEEFDHSPKPTAIHTLTLNTDGTIEAASKILDDQTEALFDPVITIIEE